MKCKVVPTILINGEELKGVLSPITIYDRHISLRVMNSKTNCVDEVTFPLDEVEIIMRPKGGKQ